jgi:hypothetical protein
VCDQLGFCHVDSENHSGAQMNLNGGYWMLRFKGTSPMIKAFQNCQVVIIVFFINV